MNLSKKELNIKFNELKDEFLQFKEEYTILQDQVKDLKASIEAYKRENKELKEKLKLHKDNELKLESKVAEVTNTKNQISFRKKELELEIQTHRKVLDQMGLANEKLIAFLEFKIKKLNNVVESYRAPFGMNRQFLNDIKLIINERS